MSDSQHPQQPKPEEVHPVIKVACMQIIGACLALAKSKCLNNDEILATFRTLVRMCEAYKDNGTIGDDADKFLDEEFAYLKSGPKVR